MSEKPGADVQRKKQNDQSKCSRSYDNFKSMMDVICERYRPLNPYSGDLFQHLQSKERPDGYTLDDTGMEFIRGGIVATVAAWESFVQDLFKEAFDILIAVGAGEPARIDNLRTVWPGCDAAIEKGRKIKAKADQQEGKPNSNQDKEDKMELLMFHSRNVLERRSILPIFLGRCPDAKEQQMSIDLLFMQLFQIREECCLSQLVIDVGSFNYIMPRKAGLNDLHVKLEQNDPSAIRALNNISRLYYGLRCTLVHGKHKKTLENSLRDFPESADNFPLPDTCKYKQDIAEYYTRMYKWIGKHAREIWVNYLTLLYTTRFYKTSAFSLMLAVAKWIYDTSKTDTSDGMLIWGFDPSKLHTAKNN